MSIDLTDARQAVVDELMPDTYTIERATLVSDGGGGTVAGGTVTLSGPCGFAANDGRLEQGDRLVQRGTYRIRVPVDADILPTDTIQIFGRSFRIVWTPPVSALSLFKRIGLEEIDGGA